jgi:hypothetical protein
MPAAFSVPFPAAIYFSWLIAKAARRFETLLLFDSGSACQACECIPAFHHRTARDSRDENIIKSAAVLPIALFLCATFVFAQDQHAEAPRRLPAEIKNYLVMKYTTWKFLPIPGGTVACRDAETKLHQSLVQGDFNGDGMPGYAIQIIEGGRVYGFELLSHRNIFAVAPLFERKQVPGREFPVALVLELWGGVVISTRLTSCGDRHVGRLRCFPMSCRGPAGIEPLCICCVPANPVDVQSVVVLAATATRGDMEGSLLQGPRI